MVEVSFKARLTYKQTVRLIALIAVLVSGSLSVPALLDILRRI
jgi:hypothetical protein